MLKKGAGGGGLQGWPLPVRNGVITPTHRLSIVLYHWPPMDLRKTCQYLLEVTDYLEEPRDMLGFNGVFWCCCHEKWWLLWSLELDVAGDLRNATRILSKKTCVVWLFKVAIRSSRCCLVEYPRWSKLNGLWFDSSWLDWLERCYGPATRAINKTPVV